MKKSITYLLTLACTVFVLAGCGQNSNANYANRLEKILGEGKIVMATSPDFAPYEFIDMTKTGQSSIVGSDITLGQYIADALGVELVIESMSFDAVLAAVTEKKVDMGISGMAYKEDRKSAMELSDDYGKGGYQGILILKADADNLKTAEDFSGKLIGAQNASLQFENVVQQLPDAKTEIVTTIGEGILALQSGKIDALAMSGTTGEQYAENYPDLAMSEFQFNSDDLGTVTAIPKGEVELLAKINEIIAEIESQDLYNQWLQEAKELSISLGVE